MKRIQSLMGTFVLLWCGIGLYAQQRVSLTLSQDDKYAITLSIEDNRLRGDTFPTSLGYDQYLVGVKASFDLTDSVTKQVVSPIQSRWINKSFASVDEKAEVDLNQLKDGMYEVALYVHRTGGAQFWNFTNPYDIVLKVDQHRASFAPAYYGLENKAVLERFPTDADFLQQCLANKGAIQTQSPQVQQLAKHILATVAQKGDDSHRAIVQEVMNWTIKNIKLNVGSYYRKDLHVDHMISQRSAVNEGVAMLVVSVLRATGVPALFMPYHALASNAAWWTSDKKDNTIVQYIPVVFYGGTWHLYNPVLEITNQMVGKGMDMSLEYFSNRGHLWYKGKVKWLVENHIRPFKPSDYPIAPMEASAVEGVDAKKHLITSYCRRYALSINIKHNQVAVEHFPYTPSFELWQVVWTSEQELTHLFDNGCVYDMPTWDTSLWNRGRYCLTIMDKNGEPVLGNKDIEVKCDVHGAEWDVAQNTLKNIKVLNEIKMTDKVKRHLLANNELYPKNNPQVVALAGELTAGLADDYQKMEAIHRWVSTNIFYDWDAFKQDKKRKTRNFFQSMKYYRANKVSTVLKYHRAVCSGYTFLSVALLRATGIPAIGLECTLRDGTEHILVMAYYADRWVVMDPTWDSTNKYEFGANLPQKITPTHMIYFDVTMPFISRSHTFTKALLNMRSSPLSYLNLGL